MRTDKTTLTAGQQAALEAVRSGRNVFITGGGGVGKSYITKRIIGELKAEEKEVMVCASTGLAATLIGGVTCHRAFRIPLDFVWECRPDPPPEVRKTDAVIIDEVSMLRMDVFDYIVSCIEAVSHPIQMIVVGDFFQLPPVLVSKKTGKNPNTTDEKTLLSDHYGFDVGQGYAFLAPGWARCNFVMCELTEVLRQSDKEMIAALNKVRIGDWSGLDYFRQHSRQEKFAPEDGATCLCGNNKSAATINLAAVDRLSGYSETYYAEVDGIVKASDKPVPDEIKLKVGTLVIMAQNSEKYVNGSYATVRELHEWGVTVEIRDTGELVDVAPTNWPINRYVVKPSGKKGKKKIELEQIGNYRQLPLKPAYAITIHKSQGQTFDKVILSIGPHGKKGKYPRLSIFAYGQLYVALSRVRSIDGLYIEGDLGAVKLLAAPEVQQFYGIDTSRFQQAPTPTPEEQPAAEEEQKPKTRTRKKSTGTRKTATTGRKRSTTAGKTEAKKSTRKKSTARKTAPKTSGRTTGKSTEMGRKTAAPVRVAAAEKVGTRADDGLVPVHCTANTVNRVWDFASRLTSECRKDGLDIRVPAAYQVRVEQAEQILRGVWES